jgi:outer membrane protein OmpA-like peptidoglycan-associated protein
MTIETAGGRKSTHPNTGLTLLLLLSSLAFAACATPPAPPPGAAEAREKLSALQSNPDLAERARVEQREAELAVRAAEAPLREEQAELGEHRVYVADRMVEIAEAKAKTQLAEDQRSRMAEERSRSRLEARTQEADAAQEALGQARSAATAARTSEAQIQEETRRETAKMQGQIDDLEAEATERGLMMTLRDVLFETGSAQLGMGPNENLSKLLSFLEQYPDRQILIEGHTDNVGSAELNRKLSAGRAASVEDYLVQRGISSRRISTVGVGEEQPIATNDSAAGRQQNRRVAIIIEESASSDPAPRSASR